MTDFIKTSASRSLENAVQEHFIPAEAPWSGIVRKGQTIRIEDSYGQQAIDTLFYRADDFAERYSNQDTMRAQGGAYIGTGTKIISNEGNVMLVMTADSCGLARYISLAPAPARATRCALATAPNTCMPAATIS